MYVDSENRFGRGPNALISLAGSDKRRCLVIADSILGFLEKYVERMATGYQYPMRGRLDILPQNLKTYDWCLMRAGPVEIVLIAKFLHFFSTIEPPQYLFVI